MSLWLPLNLRRSVSAERQSMEPTLSECQRPVKLFTLPEPTGSRSGRRLRNSGNCHAGSLATPQRRPVGEPSG